MTSESRRDLCVDAYLPGKRFDPDDLPRLDHLNRAKPEELAFAWDRRWQPGQQLRVRFLDGDRGLHQQVQEHALSWLKSANLTLVFGDYIDAEIRVTFVGDGYWSFVGTEAEQIPQPAPTMQLGGFTSDADHVELRRTVLHEFGHTIGCIHEQASPAAAIPWNVEKVYDYYEQWQGWDRDTTYANVLVRYGPDGLRFTEHDPDSIMQYPVPAELTSDGSSIGWNDELSPRDRNFIAKMYPGRTDPALDGTA